MGREEEDMAGGTDSNTNMEPLLMASVWSTGWKVKRCGCGQRRGHTRGREQHHGVYKDSFLQLLLTLAAKHGD